MSSRDRRTAARRPGGRWPAALPRAHARASALRSRGLACARHEHFGRLAEALEAYLRDPVELEARAASALDHRARHQHLAARRSGGYARGDVDVAAVVIAVAV